jgi:oligopeptide transport system substrate-binding protein
MRTPRVEWLAVFILLTACSGKSADERAESASPSSSKPAILVRGAGPAPDSLDPQKARTFEAQTILRDLCEPLALIAKDGSPAPGAANEWSATPNGLEYTFKLRPGLKWSNGDPLVANDYVNALRRLVDPATASQYASVVNVIENADDIVNGRKPPDSLGVSAPDDVTVVIRLTSVAPYLPGLVTHPSTCPIHSPSLAQHGDAFTRAGNFVTNGAFQLQEFLQGTSVSLVRNANYRDNAANRLDGVRYIINPDEGAELRSYRAGELHVTNTVPRGQFDWIQQNLKAELHISPQLNTYYYGFNLDRPLFAKNPKLRRALSMAIDRERLATSVLRVGELPAYGWVPPGTFNYTSQAFDYAAMTQAERNAEAQRLYAEAGFTKAKPAKFELRYNVGEVHSKVAVAVASMWKEVLGVEAQLTAVEFKSLIEDINRRDVEMFRLGWIGDYNDAYTFSQYWKSDFSINMPRYRNAEYDALIAAATATTDMAERRAKLEAAERVMLADHPMIPLYFYVNKHLVKPEVQGWYDNVMNVVYSKDLSLRGS